MSDDLDRRMEELRQQHLPAQIVDPWRARVARELPGWDGSIMPLVQEADGQIVYTATGSGTMGCATHRVVVSGPMQDEVIAQARTFAYFWEHIEELL